LAIVVLVGDFQVSPEGAFRDISRKRAGGTVEKAPAHDVAAQEGPGGGRARRPPRCLAAARWSALSLL
jgi:hypothetical protein